MAANVVLSYRWRTDSTHDDPNKWKPGSITWAENETLGMVRSRVIDLKKAANIDAVKADDHTPELWLCDENGNPTGTAQKVPLAWTAGKAREKAPALFEFHDEDKTTPKVFILFTFPLKADAEGNRKDMILAANEKPIYAADDRRLARNDDHHAATGAQQTPDPHITPSAHPTAADAAASHTTSSTDTLVGPMTNMQLGGTKPPLPTANSSVSHESLEDLILATGGKGKKGALQLNILDPVVESLSNSLGSATGSSSSPRQLTTDASKMRFHGRTVELQKFARYIQQYNMSVSGNKAQDHPFYVVTALPGTGKTTFAIECLHLLPNQPGLDDETREILRCGKTIHLNLNGGQATWKGVNDTSLSQEARLVARIMSIGFLGKTYMETWTLAEESLKASKNLLSFKNIIPLIATALRLEYSKPTTANVSLLLVLDEFQQMGADLKTAMRPLLTVMGDSNGPRCFDDHHIMVLPLLTGLSLDLPKEVEDISGHERRFITLEPLSAEDSFAIVRELLEKQNIKALSALLAYFDNALNHSKSFEDLESHQLCFRGMVLDCGGNPDLLKYFVRHLAQFCNGIGTFSSDNDFLDSLFKESFNKPDLVWMSRTRVLSEKIFALPTSLVPIVVASIPFKVGSAAVDDDGRPMEQTWAQLFSKCGLSPKPHPFLPGYHVLEMPYVFLNILVKKAAFVSLESVAHFPYLYRSGQAFENLVFKVHAQRTSHLVGESPLCIKSTLFEHIFPGAFVPTSLAGCPVQLPALTATREGGPRYQTEEPWCHAMAKRRRPFPDKPAHVDGLPKHVDVLGGDVFNTKDPNHHHFEGRSALHVLANQRDQTWTTLLLLWQTKLSQPGSMTVFNLDMIEKWHKTARTLTDGRWKNVKPVFVLVLHRKVTGATTEKSVHVALKKIREYAENSGDLIVITKEHMHEYIAGVSHRLHVPLEATSTANV